MAIRMESTYRIIPSEAVCVFAGMIPICITLAEHIACYQQGNTRNVRNTIRLDTMAKWQQE